MSTKRYTRIGLSLIGLVIALCACSAAGSPKEPIDLTILHTGQVAGEILPCGWGVPKGGLARRASAIAELRKEHEHVLVLDSGGSLFGGGYSTASENPKQGALIVAAMNAMGYDAMALGGFDLRAPLATLQARYGEAEFPILSVNVAPGRMLPNVQPYVLRKVGGHTVAIVGVTPATVGERLAELGLAPLAPDPVAAVKRAVRRASRRADLVVLLSTLNRSSAEALVQEVPGIDVIIGESRPTQFNPLTVPGVEGEIVLQSAGDRGEYLGLLTLNLDAQGEVTGFDGYAIALTDRYSDDPEMVELIREHARNP